MLKRCALLVAVMAAGCVGITPAQVAEQIRAAQSAAPVAAPSAAPSVLPTASVTPPPAPSAIPSASPNSAKARLTVVVVGPDRLPVAGVTVAVDCPLGDCRYSNAKVTTADGAVFDDLPPGATVRPMATLDGWLFSGQGQFLKAGTDTHATITGQRTGPSPEPTPAAAASPTPTPIPTPTPTPEPTPTPFSFNGSGGSGLLAPISLRQGVWKFTATHAGSSNFIVWLTNGSGSSNEELIFNVIGQPSGPKSIFVSEGTHRLKIDNASGGWSIKGEYQP